MMDNFDAPYFSKSISEFWRRWHISLSTWFRDYLYFPLGGNRINKIRTNINLMIVFLVSGLWHGANLTFVLWGALNGLYQIAERTFEPIKEKIRTRLNIKTNCFSFNFGQTIITFSFTCFAWIFFRAPTVEVAFDIIHRLFTVHDFWKFFDGSLYNLELSRIEIDILILAVIAMLIVDALKYFKHITLSEFLEKQNLFFRCFVIAATFVCILVYGVYGPNYDASQFIYFQF